MMVFGGRVMTLTHRCYDHPSEKRGFAYEMSGQRAPSDVAAVYASIVQEDLFSDLFAYRSMAKDVDASEETLVALCLLPL